MTESVPSVESSVESDSELAELLAEVTRKLQVGEPIDADEYSRQHPQHAARLAQLLPAMQTLADLGHSQSSDLSSAGTPSDGGQQACGVLGDFRILREIGRGGMGVVYEAEQISLRRRVALKTLPFAAVLDPRQLQRFQNEALAAASLKHPHIVQVFSVGCERGVHYYAMEYVAGQTLAEVIRQARARNEPDPAPGSTEDLSPAVSGPPEASQPSEQSPSPSAETVPEAKAPRSTLPDPRAEEFFRTAATWGIEAAEALEHAHQMGVVHRDIKPSNLLIDDRGRLLVTDFGLAQTQAGAHLTVTGDVLGTLRYMSPEQAQGNHRVLDHRTDVYSLGVTLYELLTLRAPFASDDRHTLIHQILEGNPRPLRQINPAVPKDLETIVLKAMAADPQARYGTAQDLAEDLKRFLTHEPIHARRPSATDRAAKWAQRHRAAVWATLVAMIAIVVVLAVAVGLVGRAWRVAEDRRRDADESAETAETERQRAVRNAETAEAERQRAENNLVQSLGAIDQMLTQVGDRRFANEPQLQELREALFADAQGLHDKLLAENPMVPKVRMAAAVVRRKAGMLQVSLGRLTEGEAEIRKSIAALEELARQEPVESEHRLELGRSHSALAGLLNERGDAGAKAAYERTVAIYEQLVRESPKEDRYRRGLLGAYHVYAGYLAKFGQYGEAERQFQKAAQVAARLQDAAADRDTQIELGLFRFNRSLLFQALRRLDEAEGDAGQAEKIFRRLVTADPKNRRAQVFLALSLGSRGIALNALDRTKESLAAFREAMEVLETLVKDYPKNLDYRQRLATACATYAGALSDAKQLDEAEKVCRRAIELASALAAELPKVPVNRQVLAAAQFNLSGVLASQGRNKDAAGLAGQAVAGFKALAADFPDVPAYRLQLAQANRALAQTMERAGDHAKAETRLQDASKTAVRSAEKQPPQGEKPVKKP